VLRIMRAFVFVFIVFSCPAVLGSCLIFAYRSI
jgi:hypothetical protein